MPLVHRHGDSRICDATTVVVGQSDVTVAGRLWAVEGDINSHGGGALIPSFSDVTINGKPVIIHAPDNASPDGHGHINPTTSGHAEDVSCYG